MTPKRIAVVGARGYSGLELIRILNHHPLIQKVSAFATQNFKLSQWPKVDCHTLEHLPEADADLVFLATPAETSLELAPQCLKRGQSVVDLSGAFRLKTHSYAEHYRFEHTSPEWLKEARYGLQPWLQDHSIPTSGPVLIANPGCYATAILTALLPVLKDKLIQPNSIVIDAKSGTTGAGKKAVESQLFAEVDQDCLPYRIGRHQHLPEIQEACLAWSAIQIDPFMSTSLLPVRRGITAAVYARVQSGVSPKQIEDSFRQAYVDQPLIRFAAIEDQADLLSLRKVVGTARVHLAYQLMGDKLYLYSALDNLLKGAASQAVENMNRIFDWSGHLGLEHLEALA